MTNTKRLGHISAWRASDWSRPAYCKQNGLTYPTFMKWFKLEGGIDAYPLPQPHLHLQVKNTELAAKRR